MAQIRTVVVPFDGSALAETALPYAIALQQGLGADLLVLRVLEELRPIFDAGRHELIWIDPKQPRVELESTDLLEPALRILGDAGTEPRAVIRIGDPRKEILAEAEQQPDPLIVIASHGRGGLGRAVLGSVANRVLQASTCPVLIVRAREEQQAAPVSLNRIAVPLDGSSLSEQALPLALSLARALGARLHLVRVAETYRDELPEEPSRFLSSPSYEAMLEQFDRDENEARTYLRTMSERLEAEGVSVTWEALSGDPWRQILHYAASDEPDLIVMTTHGRGGLARWFFGSVADRLLTTVDVPLLLIRASESD